jgi:hypothetical protein
MPPRLHARQSNWIDIPIEHQSCLDKVVHGHQPFCGELVGHDLDGIRYEWTGPGDVVEKSVDEDEGQDDFASGKVALSVIHSRAGRPDTEGDEHPGSSHQEKRAAADFVDHAGRCEANYQLGSW